MKKLLIFLPVPFLLAACSVTPISDQQQYLQQIQMVNRSNTQLIEEISALSTKVTTQSELITTMNKQLKSVNSELKKSAQSVSKPLDATKNLIAENTPAKISHLTLDEANDKKASPVMLGELEKVHFDMIGDEFNARIDTGATLSSLNAVNLEVFERDGNNWVKFKLHDDDSKVADKDQKWIEVPVLNYVKIRQSTSKESVRRPVVELWIRVGSLHEKTEFTLADRSKMKHPVLLGREFLRDIAVVDVSKKYVQSQKSNH